MKAMLALVFSMVVLAGACTSEGSAQSADAAAEPTCADITAEAVAGLVEAMGSGDAALVDSLLARSFSTFAEPSTEADGSNARDAELDSLTQQIANGARYKLARLDYNSPDDSSVGHFGLVLHGEVGGTIDGKGAVDCRTGKFVALGLGLPK